MPYTFTFFAFNTYAAALAGACIGFLVWNSHPAKVFMGDTGSMFLGGIVTALGIGTGTEFIMVVCSAIYIWEALSVLIQMTYFKLTQAKSSKSENTVTILPSFQPLISKLWWIGVILKRRFPWVSLK